jgi:acyl transferase domain-containing protein/3-hydroxymyristoyl/3-hydroxydecanoyl-(acyl carrier protein) dehydratase
LATPIAIVGRACVLPGALSPQALWQAVVEGRDLTMSVDLATRRSRWPQRGLRDEGVTLSGSPLRAQPDLRRGGYVEGFEAIWDPRGFAVPAEILAGLDPLVHWVLHCAREALAQVGGERPDKSGPTTAEAPERAHPGEKRTDKSGSTTADAAKPALPGSGSGGSRLVWTLSPELAKNLRIGAILGNLGFPSESMAAFAEQVWTGHGDVDPRNRHMSGGTAAILADALGLNAGSFCLDAACASSLYAIKLACGQLVDGDADLMLAGAVQRADPLFLQMGFAALGALSKSGQSRPFHRDADGLLPAEGCALLALKRLDDARRDGDRIHAVIRGIGLSNDGRGKGLLVPDEAGQRRAMRAAYADAGIDPARVSLLECHATGTTLGDSAELRSSAAVFAEARELPIGSLKSNLGHLITVAGAAGLIKLIEALHHGVRPPNRRVEAPTAALDATPFRLLQQAEPWPDSAPRIAAISAFGFGGNNAHLIVSDADLLAPLAQQRPDQSGPTESTAPRSAVVGPDLSATAPIASRSAVVGPDLSGRSSIEHPPGAIAIVGLGICVGGAADRRQFTEALFCGSDLASRSPDALATHTSLLQQSMEHIDLDIAGLRFPPRDLAQALPQQLAMLRVAREALAEVAPLPRDRTAVLIGMEPDAEVARFGLRWRLADFDATPAWRNHAQDAVIAPLEAAGVLGCMPNIPANRLSSQFDFCGPAFTLQAGTESGLQALHIARRALLHREIDAALIGAVDLCHEPVNRAAANATPIDAAIAWVLKRQADAERDGDRIYALIVGPDRSERSSPDDGADDSCRMIDRIGNAGAAEGMLRASSAALRLHHRRQVDGRPWLSAMPRLFPITTKGLPALQLSDARAHPRRSETPLPRLWIYTGADRAAVIAALESARPEGSGLVPRAVAAAAGDTRPLPADANPARLVLIATEADFDNARQRALAHLRDGAPAGSAVHFREQPIKGELAFVFAGAGASYRGMGRELLDHLPQLLDRLATRSQRLVTALEWAFETDSRRSRGPRSDLRDSTGGKSRSALREQHDPASETRSPTALQQLWGASALSQLHLEFSEALLGLKADAWLGYSSGETNALVAAGVWTDPDALMHAMEASGLITDALGGAFSAVAPQWGRTVRWASWTVLAPVAEVRAALAGIDHVHLAIINSDIDCLIAGDADGCAVVVARIGANRCLQLDYPLAVHVPELRAVAQQWFALHHRQTRAPRHGRIYSTAVGCAYAPDAESCAQAILDQADQMLDLRPVVLQAWHDGVRVFVEHGPGGSFARAIKNILGEREALVLSLDRKGQGLDGALGCAAALIAAGVPINVAALHAALSCVPATAAPQRPMRFPAHWPEIRLPVQVEIMAPAPDLPPIMVCRREVHVATVPSEAPDNNSCAPGADTGETGRDAHVVPVSAAQTAPAFVEAGSIRDSGRDLHVAAAPVAMLLRQQLTSLAQQQQGFVRIQAAAHQQFLALRAQAQTILLRGDLARERAAAAPPAAHVAPAGAPLGAVTGPSPPATPIPREITRSNPGPRPGFQHHPGDKPAAESTPVATVPPYATDAEDRPAGPSFTRAQLEIHAEGRISEIFGAAFTGQDNYARQVRMPRPPLLLADRVTALQGVPGSMGKGRICTETDVASHAWAALNGRLPAGVMIEAGQADLMLISWLGVDALNRGERVYRLLGCELTYHGDLPRLTDTLRFDIHLDGHAAQGDVRLMFFHYDCINGQRRQLSVRQGQAGFFTDAELAASAGCLWSPEAQTIVAQAQLDAPVVQAMPGELCRAQLEAFAAGDTAGCFGRGFEFARTHTRSPAIHRGRMLLLDRVSHIHSAGKPAHSTFGSPWRRGYLRAELDITPDQWFFDGHFKNDPCMPGTLMFEGCLQALAVYLAAGGHTLKRDGWRFQPVPELPYQLQCRGQVTPTSRVLVTEVFVEELIAGPIPTVYADLLCTVDGLKAFHARRVALQLVPDWPLEEGPTEVPGARPLWVQTCLDASPSTDADSVQTRLNLSRPREAKSIHPNLDPPVPSEPPVVDGFAFDQRSLLACALGRPSRAFGPMYARFDGPTRVARLPSPPYHFISRIAAIDGPIGVMRAGARVVAEYDVPGEVWYLDDNGARVMPFAVLLEAALQPCGWLSSYVGSALTSATELGFRNLDGEGTVLAELSGGAGTLVTAVEMTDVSASAGMIIENFSVICRLGDREVYRLRTVFGFFPPDALAAQAGLPVSPGQRELFEREANTQLTELAGRNGAGSRGQGPDREALPRRLAFDNLADSNVQSRWSTSTQGVASPAPCPLPRFRCRLPTAMLRMLDRIEGYWPDAGAAGLGQVRAVKDIDPGEWFFKAHFFQDPVQPGSLGLEAMLQTLQWYLLQQGGLDQMDAPRFESIALLRPHRWKYRGQVLPHHQRVHTTLEVTERGSDERGFYAIGDASLWVDGQRIYEARGLGVRVVSASA